MSKTSKKATKKKNMAAKRARKDAQRARYKKFAEMDQNKKSKRSTSKKRKTAMMTNHPFGKCGNIGCEKCFGVRFGPWLDETGTKLLPGHPHHIWLKWEAR